MAIHGTSLLLHGCGSPFRSLFCYIPTLRLDSADENDLESEIFFIQDHNVRTFYERSIHIFQCAQ